MNKYTDLSDFEINKKVAVNIVGLNLVVEKNNKIYISEGDSGVIARFDPCTNPIQAMPIIIENDIDLLNGENMMPELFGHHSAYTLHNFNTPIAADSIKEDKTIYRLGMEVFLMKKDAENENNNNS
ncbi:hypothetical protein M2263_000123 [Providencia alcalifaciens]|nr:hypothetical protein [Providencia alcalifaciens]